MRSVTMFSWGFWGWGNATPQLVAAVDAAERERGFAPPIFVDIRFRRNGRARGFNGSAFEALLGHRRYRWMQSLGNRGVDRGELQVSCPAAANQLIDLALDAAERSARVIFFCACASPWRAADCHRRAVARHVATAARRRHLSINVQEWPGGAPSRRAMSLRIAPAALAAVSRGAASVPLRGRRVPANLAGLPWGTLIVLEAGRDEWPVAAGPAVYRAGRWTLPVFRDDDGEASPLDISALRRRSRRLRRAYSLD